MPAYRIALVLLAAMLAIPGCKKKSQVSAPVYEGKGKAIFEAKGCVACHGFDGTDKPTGPDLKDVVVRRDPAWLAKWIKSPDEMLKTDPIAKELLAKYKTPMPNLGLSDQEVADVIDYMKWMNKYGGQLHDVQELSSAEFDEAKTIFFQRCSGCHGASRWGATGPSLLPINHIESSKEVAGGGTRYKGTQTLETILHNGTPRGMPAWGREGILDARQINLMARYIQMDPPEIPKLGMSEAKKNWELLVKPEDRPKSDPTNGAFRNYFGVVMRDAGKVAIVDGVTKQMLAVIDAGYAIHILRSSHSGRYFYSIGRDGKVGLIDLWYKEPKLVARGRTCWDARSVDSSKAPGFEDKYAIVGCYTPGQYAIMDGHTLEPLSITSVADAEDHATGSDLPEVRVASIVASEEKPFWVINLKEAGWVYLVDYSNPRDPKETRLKADNFLHDGGWVTIPGQKEKRYFMVAANAKNKMCVVDTVEKKVLQPCIDVAAIPHPGRGANIVDPKYGPLYVTSHIGADVLTFIGVDPQGHPEHAWKVVKTVPIRSAGSLFVKTHPTSNNVWVDMPLSAKEGVNGQVGVYNIRTGQVSYINVSPKRVVHFEYNAAGDEVWMSGWGEDVVYIYNDKTMTLKARLQGPWVKTPTGKFNVLNTSRDIY